jgi:hypothetical protein
MQRRIGRAVALVLAVMICACSDSEPVEVAGDCVDVHGAQLCSWARLSDGAVVEVGVTVPLASIAGAPDDASMTWPPAAMATVGLPESERSGLRHFTMYWEPMGHPPVTYMVPHFDFHFYRISPAERLAIDCADTTKPSVPPAAYTLPDEVLPPEVAAMIGIDTLIGVCVPEMGMHALVAEELESEVPFDGTMVVGYYHGQPIFVEPMVSRATLMERRSFDLAIPAIPGYAEQPRAFRAEYDAAQDAYRFVFSGFNPAS